MTWRPVPERPRALADWSDEELRTRLTAVRAEMRTLGRRGQRRYRRRLGRMEKRVLRELRARHNGRWTPTYRRVR